MSKPNKGAVRFTLISLAFALLVSFVAGVGGLDRIDRWVQDALYQIPHTTSGNIVVIGIDEASLEELGPYNTWDRTVMARALEQLAADPDNLPAVVAVDTLFTGTSNPEADARLAHAAAALPAVVTASSATFGGQLVEGYDGRYSLDEYAVLGYEGPYEQLAQASVQGHINAMYDTDGIMRHALLYVDAPEGRVCSMAYEAARLFAESRGEALPDVPHTDARGRFYVPFTARPGGYSDGLGIADLIAGRMPADYAAGKIVFIGPYAAGLQDEVHTPIDVASPMYGVEFQANVAEALLAGEHKTEVPDWPQLLLLFAVAAGALLLFPRLKVWAMSLVAALTAVLSFGASFLLYQLGFVTHILWVPLGVGVAYVASMGIHYVTAALERRRVTNTFERYVAPEIVNEILASGTEGLALGGKSCEIAVLFVDVRGFTTMSERLEPEKVVHILNRYLTMASECVERNRGTLDKFVGDAMMAFWGAPLPQDDPVGLAVSCARDIVKGAERVSDELKAEVGEELRVGVGVHYGRAVVGNMGSERHMDYTAIGDTVNTAARLEANAPGGCVYVSRAVANALEGRATFESLGDSVRLKGKAEGFEVLRLVELRR